MSQENLFMPNANNKDPSAQSDQHLYSSLLSIIYILNKSKISKLKLASVAEQAGLSLTRSKTPEDRFSCDVAYSIKISPVKVCAAFFRSVLKSQHLWRRENHTF